jgi:hypothetical protein
LVFNETPVLRGAVEDPSPSIPVLTVGEARRSSITHEATRGGRGFIVRTIDSGINTTYGLFYGADKGEGLDLAGDFVHALNFGGKDAVQVGDALFIGVQDAIDAYGVHVATEGMNGPYYGMNAYGFDTSNLVEVGRQPSFSLSATIPCTSQGDHNLVNVLGTVAFCGVIQIGQNGQKSVQAPTPIADLTLTIRLPAVAGQSYRLQLLFAPARFSPKQHYFDVRVDGVLIAADFSPLVLNNGGDWHPQRQDSSHGEFLRHDMFARSSSVTVELDRSPYPPDMSMLIINVLTLEQLSSTEILTQFGGAALALLDDAYVSLPPMVLGRSMSVSQWIKLGTLFDGHEEGIVLFNSFEGPACGDSDACRNAVHNTLDRHGWFAVGNDVTTRRPADLWAAGVVFDEATAALFWEAACDDWRMVTFTVRERTLHAYTSDQLQGVGKLEAPFPRMLRQSNYVGAGHGTPFRPKTGGISLAIANFRLYDRSLSAVEVAALFNDPSGEHTSCCVAAGIRSPFGVGDIDLTPQAMGVLNTGEPAAAVVSIQAPNVDGGNSTGASDCSSAQAQQMREVDICGDLQLVSDCHGTVSDGIGPYAKSADCAVRLAGFVGGRYALTFEEFELEEGADFVRIFDGADGSASLVGTFSGKKPPAALTSSGPDLYLRFTSNENRQAVGFRITFACIGTPLKYWKPATVATKLSHGVLTEPTTLRSQQMACLSDLLLSVQCCADAELSCATARVTGISLSRHQLRGSVPEQLGDLGALRSLKLHDNFLTGTFPSSLGKLHLLQELQLSHNQFAMQARTDLSKILGGMLQLQTLNLGMSNEIADLHRSIILPAPPFHCRVGEPCGFTFSTRTTMGLPLPHGGLQVGVRTSDGGSDTLCPDLMDGDYECKLPPSWTAAQKEVDFVVSADGNDFVPIRTLVDPTTGMVSTQESYQRLAVLVASIKCTVAHAHPDGMGAQCICESGYYRRGTTGGGYSCEHCNRGQEPMEGGASCSLCVPGKYSSTGEACAFCSPGNEPNKLSGADGCIPCGGHSVSEGRHQCTNCESDQIADPSRTRCVCPVGLYNSSRYDGNTVQCVAKNLRAGVHKTPSSCAPCHGLLCVKCTAGLEMMPGWSTTGSKSPWIVFGCPFRHACLNTTEGQRCAPGHTGILCAECEPGYGLTGEECVECKTTVHRWCIATVVLSAMVAVGLVVYMWWHRQYYQEKGASAELSAQLTDNPLQYEQGHSPRSSWSSRVAKRRGNAYLVIRVLYQPTRILVGYIQVRGKPCVVTFGLIMFHNSAGRCTILHCCVLAFLGCSAISHIPAPS